MNLKIALAVYSLIIWIYCLYHSLKGIENKTDFTVVLEWNAYLIDLLWILSFAEEWKRVKICLIEL